MIQAGVCSCSASRKSNRGDREGCVYFEPKKTTCVRGKAAQQNERLFEAFSCQMTLGIGEPAEVDGFEVSPLSLVDAFDSNRV